MNFIRTLFGRAASEKKEDRLPPEMGKLFDSICASLRDDARQNNSAHPSLRGAIIDGLNCDEIPGGFGDFGRSLRNPIPVNGPIGEILYLSSLMTESGTSITFHRLGSRWNIDVYEVVSLDGQTWDVLYLDFYHPRKSKKAPSGYRIITDDLKYLQFSGTNLRVPSFPKDIVNALRKVTQEEFGLPWYRAEVKIALETNEFNAPSAHRAEIQELLRTISFSPYESDVSDSKSDLKQRPGHEDGALDNFKLSFQIDRPAGDNRRMYHLAMEPIIKGAIERRIINNRNLITVPEIMPFLFKLAGELRDDIYRFYEKEGTSLTLPTIRNSFCYAFAKGAEMAYLWNLSNNGKIEFTYDPDDAIRGRAGARTTKAFADFISRGMEDMADIFCDLQDQVLLDKKEGLARDERWAADLIACALYWAGAIGLHAGMKKLGFK